MGNIKIKAQGTRHKAQESFKAQGSRHKNKVQGTRLKKEPSIKHQVPSTKHQEPRTKRESRSNIPTKIMI
jgi:hypothetical protein